MVNIKKTEWLIDRLAISLMRHDELWRAVCLLPSRESDREMLRDDAQYEINTAAIRGALKLAEENQEIEK